MKSLADQKTNVEFSIQSLEGDPIVVSRLRELGFICGERVKLVGRAPFGDPLIIEIRGSTVALRKREAQCIRI
jgi:ferrous iron transport protein A